MPWKVRDRGPGTGPVRKRLRALTGKVLVVGVTAAQSGSDLVRYAAANEFGVPGPTKSGAQWRIPPRPYLRSTLRERRPEYTQRLTRIARQVLSGASAGRELGVLGLRVVRDVRRKITALRIPPNAPSTIRKKGSSNPLIDTGRLRSSITSIVRERALTRRGFVRDPRRQRRGRS